MTEYEKTSDIMLQERASHLIDNCKCCRNKGSQRCDGNALGCWLDAIGIVKRSDKE